MLLYPRAYFKSVTQITSEFLKQNNIKALILDVDNTLIDFDKKIPHEIEQWCEIMKEQKIKLCILSNTNQKEKVERVANKLKLPYFYFAKKPLKKGFKKAIKLLKEKNESIAAVGDQIFTDVIGANRMKMFSILVEPIDKKDIFLTRIKRPLENIIIKRYVKIKQKNKK